MQQPHPLERHMLLRRTRIQRLPPTLPLRSRIAGMSGALPRQLTPLPPPLRQPGRRDLERLLVCLDLDECLVHCEVADPRAKGCWTEHSAQREQLLRGPCHEFRLQHVVQPVRVYLRPHVESFLAEASEVAELVLFTSASEEYALELSRILDPQGALFTTILSRSKCTELDPGVYMKDVGQLGRSLARTILVDDTKTSFLLQVRPRRIAA